MVLGPEFYFFLIGGVLIVMAIAAIPDLFQTATRHWPKTFFIAMCAFFAYAMTSWHFNTRSVPGSSALSISSLWETDAEREQKTKMEISDCKAFVEAEYNAAQKEKFIPASTGADARWEFCAREFGLNYWKHDISINGQNGGQVLCRAYRSNGYRSANVESWCSTVFAGR